MTYAVVDTRHSRQGVHGLILSRHKSLDSALKRHQCHAKCRETHTSVVAGTSPEWHRVASTMLWNLVEG